MNSTNELIALIATTPRFNLLMSRSLPSICSQKLRPKLLVLVTDKILLTLIQQQQIIKLMHPTLVVFLENRGKPGVASTWNSGIDYIYAKWPHSYTAILDDDDTWDENHLSLCQRVAIQSKFADIILSGLRTVIRGNTITNMPIDKIITDDFLIGNPGWQGTNTFVKTSTLIKAGKFTDGLVSTNDRDLAVRLLSLNKINIAYTNTCTATWYCGERQDALSAKKSPQKLEGLSQFYAMYCHMMTRQTKQHFFQRAKDLFNFEEQDIIQLSENYIQYQNVRTVNE